MGQHSCRSVLISPGKRITTALIAAAGAGGRFGANAPKAFVELRGRPLLGWCLEAFERSDLTDFVVIAAPEGKRQAALDIAGKYAPKLRVKVVAGGPSRSHSVLAALEEAEACDYVCVHDAARPVVTPELIDSCITELERKGCDAVVLAAPLIDTVKRADDSGRVIETLDRGGLWAVQTPQAFTFKALEGAFGSASDDEIAAATDDSQLVEPRGGDVRLMESPPENIKVTTKLDLKVAGSLLDSVN